MGSKPGKDTITISFAHEPTLAVHTQEYEIEVAETSDSMEIELGLDTSLENIPSEYWTMPDHLGSLNLLETGAPHVDEIGHGLNMHAIFVSAGLFLWLCHWLMFN